MGAMKWVLAGLTGLITGALAFIINLLRNNLQLLKYTQLKNGKKVDPPSPIASMLLNICALCLARVFYLMSLSSFLVVLSATLFEGTAVLGLLVLLGFNLVYAFVAVLVIALEVSNWCVPINQIL